MIRKKIGPKSVMNKLRQTEEESAQALSKHESARKPDTENQYAGKVVSSERKRLAGPKSRVKRIFLQDNGEGENAEKARVETRQETFRIGSKSSKRRRSSSSSLSSSDDFEPEKKDSKGRPQKKADRKLLEEAINGNGSRKMKTPNNVQANENGREKMNKTDKNDESEVHDGDKDPWDDPTTSEKEISQIQNSSATELTHQSKTPWDNSRANRCSLDVENSDQEVEIGRREKKVAEHNVSSNEEVAVDENDVDNNESSLNMSDDDDVLTLNVSKQITESLLTLRLKETAIDDDKNMQVIARHLQKTVAKFRKNDTDEILQELKTCLTRLSDALDLFENRCLR